MSDCQYQLHHPLLTYQLHKIGACSHFRPTKKSVIGTSEPVA